MKVSFVFLLFVATFLALASATPFKKSALGTMEMRFSNLNVTTDDTTKEIKERFRRVTCDLLSVDTPIGSVNHAACAAHCLSMGKGFKGGSCVNGVCHCRK